MLSQVVLRTVLCISGIQWVAHWSQFTSCLITSDWMAERRISGPVSSLGPTSAEKSDAMRRSQPTRFGTRRWWQCCTLHTVLLGSSAAVQYVTANAHLQQIRQINRKVSTPVPIVI